MNKCEILSLYPFYASAGSRLRAEIERAAIVARLGAGEFYFREGDTCAHIGLIGKGSLRVYKTGDSGREITLYHVGVGESCILTASCLLSGMAYPAHAEVESEVEALIFPGEVFRSWVASIECIRSFVFSEMADRVAGVMSLVEEVTFGKMDERFASYLAGSFHNHGRPVRILNTTHEQIATELGSAREVVSRLLKELERIGAVRLARCKIVLTSENLLLKHAGSSA